MSKRIVVCSDGTGNTAIAGRGTNVFKVFEAVDLESHRYDATVTPQVAIYDDGVGTGNFKPLKWLGGAAGLGLSRNVRHLYAELARIYDPGDEIYMFGFSRGAFTVRTLVGLIATCGIIDIKQVRNAGDFDRLVDEAYRSYRKCYAAKLQSLFTKPSPTYGKDFKQHFSHNNDVRVRFLGVWDTVDAVGMPFRTADLINATVHRFKFPDLKLSPIVDRACHALAIDDERQSFHPLMFEETAGDAGRIEQVWFAGCHSNIGGGYPKQGMSLVTLDWMLDQAESAGLPYGERGLRLNNQDRVSFREHATVDDKLYDPRSGTGVLYRWKIRDIGAICAKHHVEPKIHVSVMERIAHGTDAYSPGNLPKNAKVVASRPPNSKDETLAHDRAKAGEMALGRLKIPSLMESVRGSIAAGTISYYLFLVSLIAAILAATLTTQPHPALPLAIAGLLVAYALSLIVDRRLSLAFSEYWFGEQQKLRASLKGARSKLRTPVSGQVQTLGRAVPARVSSHQPA